MTKPVTFDLIDGTFKPDEAKSVLFNLIQDKINYHELERFSAQERFGIELPHSQKRISQLNESLLKIQALVEASEKANVALQISGTIEIAVVEKKAVHDVF